MTAKDYLGQLKYLDKLINAKMLERDRLKALAEKVTPSLAEKVQGGKSESMSDTVIKIVELDEEIAEEVDKLVELKREARTLISEIAEGRHRTVLDMYYLMNMTFEKISEHMYYSLGTVHNLHKAALREFQLILAKTEKNESESVI